MVIKLVLLIVIMFYYVPFLKEKIDFHNDKINTTAVNAMAKYLQLVLQLLLVR